MIRLHTWTTPNGRKISIALEELSVPYEVRKVDLGANEQQKPDFLALNPNHKIPVLEDDGLVIWESGAILLHLGEKHDPRGLILPRDARKRSEAIQYAFFQTGGVGPNLGRLGAALRKEGEKNAEMIQIFSTEMARLYGVLDRILADGREYLAGDYSIGDIMHYPWLAFPLQLQMPDLIKLPRVVAWLERVAARPAVKKGMAVPA
ncbi:MAG: glutathione S-transferase family protein [Myxococcota bacterium]